MEKFLIRIPRNILEWNYEGIFGSIAVGTLEELFVGILRTNRGMLWGFSGWIVGGINGIIFGILKEASGRYLGKILRFCEKTAIKETIGAISGWIAGENTEVIVIIVLEKNYKGILGRISAGILREFPDEEIPEYFFEIFLEEFLKKFHLHFKRKKKEFLEELLEDFWMNLRNNPLKGVLRRILHIL